MRALWFVSGLAGRIYITVIYTGLKFKGLLSIWLKFTCEFWTIMSIIRVKGMFLTTQSHNFGGSCLWVDARRSSTVVLLELKDIYYFSRSDLYWKIRNLGPLIRAEKATSCSDWLIVTIVPNALISFSALDLYSKFFSSMETFSFWKIDNRRKIILKILKEAAFVGCKFQAKFCAFVGLFDSTIQLRKSSYVAVQLFRNRSK